MSFFERAKHGSTVNARRINLIVSLLVFVTVGVFWYGQDYYYQKNLLAQNKSELHNRLNTIGASLTSAINRRQALITGLATFIKLYAADNAFDQKLGVYAAGLMANDPVIRAIQYFPIYGSVFVYPSSNNVDYLGHTLNSMDERPLIQLDIQRAIESHRVTISSPFQLHEGGQGVETHLAVYRGEELMGIVTLVLNLEPLLEIPGLIPPPADIKMALSDANGRVFFGSADVFASDPVSFHVPLPEEGWTLAAIPQDGWQAESPLKRPYFWLSGLLVAVLLSGLTFIVTSRQYSLEQTVQTQHRQLGESEGQLRLAIEAANIGFFDLDLVTNRIIISPELKKQLGYQPDEVADEVQTWTDFLHPDDRQRAIDYQNDTIQNLHQRYESVFRLRHADGSYRWILSRGTLQLDSEGKPIHLLGYHIDITAQKMAEEAILASERRFRSLAECSHDFIVLYDREGRHVYANPSALKEAGLSEADLIGKTLHEVGYTDEIYAHWDEHIREVFNTGRPLQKTLKGRAPNSVRYFDWLLSPVMDEHGEVELVLGISREVTALKQAEAALRENENRLRFAMEGANDGLWDVQMKTGIIYISPRGCEMMGISLEESHEIVRNWHNYVHLDDIPIMTSRLQAHFAGDTPHCEFELRLRTKSGGWLWVLLRGKLVERDSNGQPVRMTGTFSDITARKQADAQIQETQVELRKLLNEADLSRRALLSDIEDQRSAEEQIRRLNAELEQRVRDRTSQLEAANQELEAFAYSVSHDLRAPLRGIDGWSLAILEDYSHRLDDQGRQYLQRVRAETQRMGQLIDDLLRLSRLTRTEMQYGAVDLSALARSIQTRLCEGDPERQFEFIIQPGLTVFGDAHLLEIVLTNLLSNAIKFTGSRPVARIEFGRIRIDGKPVYFVRDNGVGFDMAYARNLFGPFQRMHKQSEFPGTGIGLATVQRVIHRHGGRVWAEAVKDQGATFFFTL